MIRLSCITSICVVLTLSGCIFDGGSDTITDGYETSWIDTHDERTIDKEIPNQKGSYIGIVGPSVYAVGHNGKFIIAKQHPPKKEHHYDTALTHYYIIEMHPQEDSIIGPLTLYAFDSTRKSLGIEKIKFDMNY